MTSSRLGRFDVPRSKLVLAVAAAWSLAACASLAPHDATLPSTPVPASWSAPASGTPISLASVVAAFRRRHASALVGDALQANTNVRSAQAALRQARAARDVSAAQLRRRSARRHRRSAAERQRRRATASGRLRRELGARHLRRQAQRAERERGRRAGERRKPGRRAGLDRRRGGARLHAAARHPGARWRSRADNLAPQEETLQITRWRTQAGLASSLEVEQALAATEQTRAQIPALQTSIAQARHSLARADGPRAGGVAGALECGEPDAASPERPRVEHPGGDAAPAPRRARGRASDQRGDRARRAGRRSALPELPVERLGRPERIDARCAERQRRARRRAAGQRVGADLRRRRAQGPGASAGGGARARARGLPGDGADRVEGRRGRARRAARRPRAPRASAHAAEAADNASLLARQRYQSGIVDFQTVLDTQRTLLSTQDALASTQPT